MLVVRGPVIVAAARPLRRLRSLCPGRAVVTGMVVPPVLVVAQEVSFRRP
jgi:hypothetical protein